jgi:hypothetical protein
MLPTDDRCMHALCAAGTPRVATIVGTKATAVLPFPFWCPTTLRLERDGGDQQPGAQVETFDFPLPHVPVRLSPHTRRLDTRHTLIRTTRTP